MEKAEYCHHNRGFAINGFASENWENRSNRPIPLGHRHFWWAGMGKTYQLTYPPSAVTASGYWARGRVPNSWDRRPWPFLGAWGWLLGSPPGLDPVLGQYSPLKVASNYFCSTCQPLKRNHQSFAPSSDNQSEGQTQKTHMSKAF